MGIASRFGQEVLANINQGQVVRALLARYGMAYAQEIGIRLQDKPAPLFQLLYSALLMSARISAANASQAAKALVEAGLTTPEKMAQASWQDRVDVITWHGYKRYDERTSTMLGDTAAFVIKKYKGDLRKLRDEAERDVKREHQLLQQFSGIGAVGADIFMREVQLVWDETYLRRQASHSRGPPSEARCKRSSVVKARAAQGLSTSPRRTHPNGFGEGLRRNSSGRSVICPKPCIARRAPNTPRRISSFSTFFLAHFAGFARVTPSGALKDDPAAHRPRGLVRER
jgi:endonuclease III